MATKNFVRVSAEATEAAKFQGFIGNAQLSLTHLFRGINTFCFSFCPSDACGPLAIVPARRGQLFIQNEEAGGVGDSDPTLSHDRGRTVEQSRR